METIKKIIVVLLMAAGIILLMGESEMTWERTLLMKLIGIGSLAGALQLTATWKLFMSFIVSTCPGNRFRLGGWRRSALGSRIGTYFLSFCPRAGVF